MGFAAVAVVAALAVCGLVALQVRRSAARLNRRIQQLHEEQNGDAAPTETWQALAEIWRENGPQK